MLQGGGTTRIGKAWPGRWPWFTATAYARAAQGFVHHPYWEVDQLLDLCLPEPVFFPPWETFGLARIPPEILRRRADEFLVRVMARG